MKLFYLLLSPFLFFTQISLAQIQKNSNDVSLVKEIHIGSFTGKKFSLQVDLKNRPSDSSGKMDILLLQVGKGDYDFIISTKQTINVAVNDSNWNHYTIQGAIDPKAYKIWVYLEAKGNGDFYFDNFNFSIQDSQKRKNLFENGDFEQIKSPLKMFKNTESLIKNKNIFVEIAKENDNKYKNTLHIKGRNGKQFVDYNYGNNKTTGHYLISNNCNIYYEVYGEGNPLLLLHGNGGSISQFRKQIPELANHFKVIAVDSRGQGKSRDTISENFSYDLFADDMKTLLDSLHLKQINLLGWSDGGNTGLILAMKYPDYVKKLVVMGANLNPTEDAVTKKILTRTKKDIERLKQENKPENEVTIKLLEMLLKEPNIKPSDLKNIKAKTLVLAGEKDLILEKHTRLIAENIPDSEIQILKGQTHMAPDENPTLFNKVGLDFLLKN